MNNQNHLSNFQRLTIISPLWTRLQGWVRLRRESCESCESWGWERTQIKVEGFNLLQTGWIWSTSINRTNISMVVNENIFLIISPLPFYHARTVSALSKSWARAVSPRERRGGITTLQDGWNCVLISSDLMELNNKCGNTTYKLRCIATCKDSGSVCDKKVSCSFSLSDAAQLLKCGASQQEAISFISSQLFNSKMS